VHEQQRDRGPGEARADSQRAAGEHDTGVQPLVAADREEPERGDAARGVTGRGHPRRVEPAAQRVALLGIEGQQVGQHVRRVGRLVEHVQHLDAGGAAVRVRIRRGGHHEAGGRPPQQQGLVVGGGAGQSVAEQHDREPAARRVGPVSRPSAAVAGGRIPDRDRQRPVTAAVEPQRADPHGVRLGGRAPARGRGGPGRLAPCPGRGGVGARARGRAGPGAAFAIRVPVAAAPGEDREGGEEQDGGDRPGRAAHRSILPLRAVHRSC
jgi:hypothetical protein